MTNLRTIIRIKTMASSAAEVSERPSPEEGAEMAAAYARLRRDALAMFTGTGWGDEDEFAEEVPPLAEAPVRAQNIALYGTTGEYLRATDKPHIAAAAGRRARVLLLQLAGWAEGHQQAYELEEQMRANAEARVAQSQRRPIGFSRD